MGQRVLESVYPHQATALLKYHIWQSPNDVSTRNTATMEALLSGDAYRDPVWRDLVTGSRAEGLGIEEGWGHEPADADIMFLHGQSWGVSIPNEEVVSMTDGKGVEGSVVEPFLEMTDADVLCFCRVKVNGRLEDLVDRIGQGIAHGTTTPVEIKAGILMVGALAVCTVMYPVMTMMGMMGIFASAPVLLLYGLGSRAQIYHRTTADSYREMDAFRRRLPDMISRYWSIGQQRVMECFYLWNGIQYLCSILRLNRLFGSHPHFPFMTS